MTEAYARLDLIDRSLRYLQQPLFGRVFKAIREFEGKEQTEVAEAAERNQRFISRVENAEVELKPAVIESLIRALGYTVSGFCTVAEVLEKRGQVSLIS